MYIHVGVCRFPWRRVIGQLVTLLDPAALFKDTMRRGLLQVCVGCEYV